MQNDNMYQGNLGGPTVVEDGAVQTGWGKYRLQFLGSDKPKEISLKVIISVVCVVLAVVLLATFLGGKEPKGFPDEVILRNAIGKPLEEAVLLAGVKVEDLTETEPGEYRTNKTIELDNVNFELYFYAIEGDCSGFAYIADYQADAKKASKDIYNTFVNLGIRHFDQHPEILNDEDREALPNVTKRQIRKYLEEGNLLKVKHTHDLDAYFADLRTFMDKLEGRPEWEGKVDGYLVRRAVLYLDKGGAYDPNTQRVQLVLSYRIEPQRETMYD